MASKKVYAVKKGRQTGIFLNWEDCKKAVDGFPGAEYKSFTSMQEASDYLGMSIPAENETNNEKYLLSYVDGSYEEALKRYAFGCVFILPNGKIYTQYGNGDNEQSLQHRNVTGEMLGAMYAVKTAIMNEFQEIEICYDYQGIEKWVTGEWRAKQELTKLYAKSMREWRHCIQIRFTKVAAHTNVKYNELADRMAKKGLVDGKGIPKVMMLAEMDEYIDGNKDATE